jgi:hypothetical protein
MATKQYAVGYEAQSAPKGFEAVPVDALIEFPDETAAIVINGKLEDAETLVETALAIYPFALVMVETDGELRLMPEMQKSRPEACAVYVWHDEEQSVEVTFYNDGYAEVRRKAEERTSLHIIPAREAWKIAAMYAPQEEYQLKEMPLTD